MPSNSITVLNGLLDQEKNVAMPEKTKEEYFEYFVSEQVLKNYGLSYEEIEFGIVGGGGDGGIDSLYTFVNGVLVGEDTDFSNIKQNVLINLIIIQSKTESGFSEDTVTKFENMARDILDTSHDLLKYKKQYKIKLLDLVGVFIKTYRTLSANVPELKISFYYATKGNSPHPNVSGRTENLKSTIYSLFTQCEFNFKFLGADELLTLNRKSKSQTHSIEFTEAIPTESMGKKANICLVKLKEYYNFISDKVTGELRGWLFEENIRDYEGRNKEVNKGIRKTLESPKESEDFWWLNNGITIITSSAPADGKTITLVDPKIVNGLQTSMEIFNYFRSNPSAVSDNKILLRIINTIDELTRNDIIVATNSQSVIKAASLRAFDEIHFKIEKYFESYDVFYERRKNYYKNLKKPRNKIVSVSYVAQSVAAIILQRPNDSRARPLSLIKQDALYNSIFNEINPIELYLDCVLFMKNIDEYLSSDLLPSSIKGQEVNIRYHLAMFSAAMLTKRIKISHNYFNKHRLGLCDFQLLKKDSKYVWGEMNKMKVEKGYPEDRIAKSSEFDQRIKKLIHGILRTKEVDY